MRNVCATPFPELVLIDAMPAARGKRSTAGCAAGALAIRPFRD